MFRRRLIVALVVCAVSPACALHSSPRLQPRPIAVEALTDPSTIRARCVDPDGVIAGRVFCVLKDLPADQALLR